VAITSSLFPLHHMASQCVISPAAPQTSHPLQIPLGDLIQFWVTTSSYLPLSFSIKSKASKDMV